MASGERTEEVAQLETKVAALSETFDKWGWDKKVPYVLLRWAQEKGGTFEVNPDGGFVWEKKRRFGGRSYLTTKLVLEPKTDHFPSIDVQVVGEFGTRSNLLFHLESWGVSNMVYKRGLPFKGREGVVIASHLGQYGFVINQNGFLPDFKSLR